MSGRRKYVKYLMAFSHFCADFSQGTLAAVLPFLIASCHYNYATAASLVMVSNLVGSVIQPVFGAIADKVDKPHLLTLGVLLAGGGMACAGFIPNFAGLCVAVVVSGIGVAMIHPQGARMVNRMADESNRGMSMGIFSFGGNVGFTIGPVAASGAVTLFGLKGTLTFLVPAVIFAAIMTLFYKDYEGEEQIAPPSEKAAPEDAKDLWGEFAKLGVLITCRSIMFSGVSTFLILYMIEAFGMSKPAGSALLSIYYGVAALSSLIGGKLADIAGYKRTLIFSQCILAVGSVAFALNGNLVAAVVIIALTGIGVSMGYSPMVTLGQLYLPNHIGLASGMTLGLSVSIGGILAPVLGTIGDRAGLHLVFVILAGVSIIPLVISILLKDKNALR